MATFFDSQYFSSVPAFAKNKSPTAPISYLLQPQARKLPPFGLMVVILNKTALKVAERALPSGGYPGETHSFRRLRVQGAAVQVQHVSGNTIPPHLSREGD